MIVLRPSDNHFRKPPVATHGSGAPRAVNRCVGDEATAEIMERHWFAALHAAKTAQAECEALLGAMRESENAWKQALARAVELETLRDMLGEQLAMLDGSRGNNFTRGELNAVRAASISEA